MASGIPSAARINPPRYSCKRARHASAINGCRSFVLNTMWKCRLKCVDGIRDSVAERHWRLARHGVSGHGEKKKSREATPDISQTRQCLEQTCKNIRLERTVEMCAPIKGECFHRPFRTRTFCGTPPDTSCLANFQLCLRHERRVANHGCRGATGDISQLRSGWK